MGNRSEEPKEANEYKGYIEFQGGAMGSIGLIGLIGLIGPMTPILYYRFC
jgi:hypothetical protein